MRKTLWVTMVILVLTFVFAAPGLLWAATTELSLIKEASPDPIPAGDDVTVTYTLTYQNTGTGPHSKLLLVDILPPQLVEYVSSTPEGAYDSGLHQVEWLLSSAKDPLLAGEGGIVTLVVRVDSSLSEKICNVVLYSSCEMIQRELIICTPVEDGPPGEEGCTPGFWKNHTDLWVGYSTGDLVGDIFDVPNNLSKLADNTLLEALKYGGGGGLNGAAKILLRAAVAALLNAASADVNYPLTEGDIIGEVNAALDSGDRETMLLLAGELDRYNNLVCPLE